MKSREFLFCCCLIVFGSLSLLAQEETLPPRQVQNLDDLIEILQTDMIQHEANLEEQYVVVPIQRGNLNAIQVVRWAARDGVIHFIQVIPLQVPDEHRSNVESGMLRLNHSYPIPGLGLNHETKTPYFRFSVPLQPRGYLLENEVKEYFNFCVNQSIQFAPTLAALSTGEVRAEEVLISHRQRIQAALGPLGSWKRQALGSDWTLNITAQGEVTLQRDGQVVVDSLAKISGTQITFDDVTGPLAADGVGIYEFQIESGKMTFKLVQDASEGRQQILSSGPWER